jgi:hypothetical protein
VALIPGVMSALSEHERHLLWRRRPSSSVFAEMTVPDVAAKAGEMRRALLQCLLTATGFTLPTHPFNRSRGRSGGDGDRVIRLVGDATPDVSTEDIVQRRLVREFMRRPCWLVNVLRYRLDPALRVVVNPVGHVPGARQQQIPQSHHSPPLDPQWFADQLANHFSH